MKLSTKFTDIEICPLCSSSMIIKDGKYGLFWSCNEWPKCKGSKHIEKLGDLSLVPLDFFDSHTFLGSGPFNQIKSMLENTKVPGYIKEIVEYLKEGFYKGLVDKDCVRGKVSGLIDLLSRDEKRFLLAQFSYFIYQVEGGELPERFDFFLKRIYKPGTVEQVIKHKEYQIKKALVSNWTETPFYKLFGYDLVGEEVTLQQITGLDNQCKVDIVGKNANNEIVLIEIKNPKAASKSAWGQVHVYRETVKRKCPGVGAYIVTCGYPRGIIDNTIGLVGYTIQDNNIALIPWREAKILY